MSGPSNAAKPRFRGVLTWACLAAAALAAYGPALRGSFLWDDDGHVTRPDLRPLHGLWRIWFELGATQQYYPVLHSAFWVEHRLWGDAPLGYHVLNVLLHATAAFLFVCVLRMMVERPACLGEAGRRRVPRTLGARAPLLAGFVFALHPVCVESVAWISEQKNTLSAVFYLLAMLVYLKYTGIFTGRSGRSGRIPFKPFLQEGRKDREEYAQPRQFLQGDRGGRGARHLSQELPMRSNVLFPDLPDLPVKKATAQQPLRDLCDLPVKKDNSTKACFPIFPTFLLKKHWFGNFDPSRSLRSSCKKWYFVSFLLFVLAVLSKSVTATLPAALLVILWWKRGTLSWKRDVFPLLPFFAVGIAGGLLTAWVERTYIGAHGAAFALSPVERCLLAGRALGFYLGKIAWPGHLIFNYERWRVSASEGWQFLHPVAALAVLAALWSLRRRSRAPLAAALFFAGTLFPALGFFNVYPFVFSYVADHFQYLAMLGVIALGVGGWASLAESRSKDAGGALSARGTGRSTLQILLIGALGFLTWHDCHAYRSDAALYTATVQANPTAWLAQDNLGVVLAREGRLQEAVVRYREALRLKPDYPETYNNLGNALAQLGNDSDAEAEYAQALQIRPNFSEAQYDWGNALNDSGRYAEAAYHYSAALRLRPDYPQADYRMANALANSGRMDEAIARYRAALALRPEYPEARANLGLALATAGHLPEALQELQRAVQLAPSYPEAHAYLGLALALSGQLPEAVEAYRDALRLRPADADVRYQLGVALRRSGRLPEAAAEFRETLRLRPSDPAARDQWEQVEGELGEAGQAGGDGEAAR